MPTETQKVYQAELERLENALAALHLTLIKADLELRSCTYDSQRWARLARKVQKIAKQLDELKPGDLFEAPHHD